MLLPLRLCLQAFLKLTSLTVYNYICTLHTIGTPYIIDNSETLSRADPQRIPTTEIHRECETSQDNIWRPFKYVCLSILSAVDIYQY
ncbi:hypothetical protein J1614_009569 [Plenodomus biglobosus]|nr:hypothetical protein J1614_009569 [Plenodomus biglobosus]